MKSILLILIGTFLINWNTPSFQTITINGAATVTPGASEYYEASFDYTVNPYALLSWNVTGGTITSQGVNPSSTVYCYVDWDNTPGMGNISLYEDLNGISGDLDVQIAESVEPCYIADAGPDKGYCTTGSVSIGTTGHNGYIYS